ncbi:MAG TPA: hypothetical protein VFY10_11635 [Dehalococcoidia bacterium]|nr:hypothetical protein [Dehalococcoidia bacterium]
MRFADEVLETLDQIDFAEAQGLLTKEVGAMASDQSLEVIARSLCSIANSLHGIALLSLANANNSENPHTFNLPDPDDWRRSMYPKEP